MWTRQDKEIEFTNGQVLENSESVAESFVQEQRSHGSNHILLSKEDVSALQDGKIIGYPINGGEYTLFISGDV